MRAWPIVLAACTPEIAPGTYLCGVEQTCPPGLACNGADGTCVVPAAVEAFACDPAVEHEPDNDIAHAQPVLGLACVSAIRTIDGCLAPNDPGDWFGIDAPAGCTAVEAKVRLTFSSNPSVNSIAAGSYTGTKLHAKSRAAASAAVVSFIRCVAPWRRKQMRASGAGPEEANGSSPCHGVP